MRCLIREGRIRFLRKSEMTIYDEVFRLIPEDELADPNSFCHYGWEGIGAFAFWKYANAYFDSIWKVKG